MATIKVGNFKPGANVGLFTEKNVTAVRTMGEAPVGAAIVSAAADANGEATLTHASVLAGIAYAAYGERRYGGNGYVQALVSTTKGWPS